MCSICGDVIKAIDHYIAMADDDLKDELEDEGRALPDDSVEMANNLEDGIAAALILETAYFIEQIKKQNSVADLMDLLKQIREQDIVNKEIEKITAEQLKKYIPKMVVHYAMDVDEGIKITAVSKRTTAWIDTWSKELGELMKLNSNTEIENILKMALENGDDIQTVTRTILDSGIRDEYYKARRVAMTEMFRAHNVSKYEAALQNPCIVSKRWRHSGRGKPRPNHKAMDGVTVPKNEPFVLQGADGSTYYPMHPVDSCLPAGEAVNCHCTVDDVVDEEILGLSTGERQKLRDEALAELDEEWEKSVDEKYRALVGLSTDEKYIDNLTESGIINTRAANDIEIRGISKHVVERCAERGVSFESVKDALEQPLHIGDAKEDADGRISQRFIGRTATVNVNPDTGNIITAWRTGKSDLKKYSKGE